MITERTLGIATIGQAPRDDIAALFSEQAPSSTRILLQGCLDNLTDEQIVQRPPMDGADTLYTRLRGGVDVKISIVCTLPIIADTNKPEPTFMVLNFYCFIL